MGLFGTSGIRGVFGTEVTPELALKVGYALGSAGAKVLVGRDTRASGEVLQKALASGIIAAGGEFVKLGIVSTPTLGHATAKFNCLGVMITASHNPPEYNGIKIFEKGTEARMAREKEIEKSVTAGKPPAIDWKTLGRASAYEGAIHDHIALALAQVDVALISKKKPKVLVDCGNGAASIISPFALRKAGCTVVGVNCEPSTNFARKLEPNAENLSDFSKMVKACGAQMGIAHDGDGDRAIILDERGELLGLDSQLALMAESELALAGGKGTVVTTVEASLAVREAIEKHGGKAEIVPVGSREVGEKVAEKHGIFGGEPCGEYIYPKAGLLADGTLTALKFVELMCRKGSLGAQRLRVRAYPIMRGRYPAKDKHKAMARIRGELSRMKGKHNVSDGIRVDFENSWVLVRASGTEPIVRITCEARDAQACRELYSKAEAIVKKAVR